MAEGPASPWLSWQSSRRDTGHQSPPGLGCWETPKHWVQVRWAWSLAGRPSLRGRWVQPGRPASFPQGGEWTSAGGQQPAFRRASNSSPTGETTRLRLRSEFRSWEPTLPSAARSRACKGTVINSAARRTTKKHKDAVGLRSLQLAGPVAGPASAGAWATQAAAGWPPSGDGPARAAWVDRGRGRHTGPASGVPTTRWHQGLPPPTPATRGAVPSHAGDMSALSRPLGSVMSDFWPQDLRMWLYVETASFGG